MRGIYFLSLFLVSMLAISGCVNRDRVPNQYIQPEKMRNLMWDLARVDQFASDFVLRDTNLKREVEAAKLYEIVFALHKVSREEFRSSLVFYESRPDLLKKVMDSLNATARRMEQETYEPTPTVPGNTGAADSTAKKPRITRKKLLDSLKPSITPQ